VKTHVQGHHRGGLAVRILIELRRNFRAVPLFLRFLIGGLSTSVLWIPLYPEPSPLVTGSVSAIGVVFLLPVVIFGDRIQRFVGALMMLFALLVLFGSFLEVFRMY
jgi:hypothetical protein